MSQSWIQRENWEFETHSRLTPNKRLMSARFAADWRLVAALARRDPNSPLVFHRNGIAIRRWRTAWRTACQAAGVPTRFLHDCRRTAARNPPAPDAQAPRHVASILDAARELGIRDAQVIEAAESDLKTLTSSRREHLVEKYGPDPDDAFRDADPLDLQRLATEVQQEALKNMGKELNASQRREREARSTGRMSEKDRDELLRLREIQRERRRRAQRKRRAAESRPSKKRRRRERNR